MKYTIMIQWSDEAECYLVSLPEFERFSQTHGETYEEELRNTQAVLESLVKQY